MWTAELSCGADSTPVFNIVSDGERTDLERICLAFEFSKRRFSKVYGPELPVWALLASGSTGGVCMPQKKIIRTHSPSCVDRILALMLSTRFVFPDVHHVPTLNIMFPG